MLLSHKHNFLFIHIAKTGGTSVRSALSKYKWGHKYSVPQFLASKLSGFTGHKIGSKFPRHCKAIAAREMLPGDFYNQLYKFTVVRNPFDLQVSAYHHIEKEHPRIFAQYDIKNFADFIAARLDKNRPFEEMLHAPLQSDYLVDMEGNVIVDKMCRFEHLQDDFNDVCKHIHLPEIQLPHKRKAANRKDTRSYYSEREIEMVSEHYQKDLALLNYQFE